MPRLPAPTRRASRWIRVIALAVIVLAPVVFAAWHTRRPSSASLAEVLANDTASGLAEYLATRHAAVDRLLPEGDGGTRFVRTIEGGAGGVAIAVTATILVRAGGEVLQNAEYVELHERAHLAHAFLPREVEALLTRVAPPEPNEYAAKNPGEHFGEMAAQAWNVLVEPRGACFAESMLDRLDDAEQRVPGTAGFVVWFLRDSAFHALAQRERVLARALELSARWQTEWSAIHAALEARRLPNGTFARWHAMNSREYLSAMFSDEWRSAGALGRLRALTLLPGLALLTVLG